MTEEQAVYGGGKHCGNCGIRVNGECTLDRAEMEHCLFTPGRPHWRKLATDREKLQEFLEAGKVVAQCTEKPDTIKKNDHPVPDLVNHPAHYTSHPSGIEVIQITEHENFCRGNAIKYILRAGKKGSEIEDLKKAVWYINREIERISE